ncbi:hypothetical protein AB0300_18550 [Microbacterium sp. NPDC078814]|uniref:hypothetical protein n=1 Tax=Microbacterium sp. NPDC078814 TaxID=3154767 RepID=UPI003450D66D
MESPRECWVHDTFTGDRLFKLNPEGSSSWTAKVSGVDESSLEFVAEAQGFDSRAEARAAFNDYFDADTRFLVVSWGDHIESATFNRVPEYDMSAGTFKVTGRGIRAFANDRSTFGVNNYINGDLTITNRTHSGAAARVMARLTQWAPEWNLPVDLSADASGAYSRAVKRDEMVTGESLFQAIEEQGYEIGFRPYFTSTYSVRWQMLVQPQIAIGAAIDVPLSVEKPVATDVSVTDDSSKRLTGVFYVGRGHGEDTITAWAGSPNGRPIRDAFRYAKDIRDQAALQAMSNAAFAAERFPVRQWSLAVDAGDDFSPMLAAPGRLLDMSVADDWWVADGTYRQRVVSVRGSYGSLTLRPEVQAYG